MAIASSRQVSITDEILKNLHDADMGIFDLGGLTAEDEPNPNVMYELGIRHAFGKPCLIYAWNKARLPFDVSGQRVALHPRRIGSMLQVRKVLRHALAAAEEGHFHRPMAGVATATLIKEQEKRDPAFHLVADQLKRVNFKLDTLAKSQPPPTFAEIAQQAHLAGRPLTLGELVSIELTPQISVSTLPDFQKPFGIAGRKAARGHIGMPLDDEPSS